MRFFSLFVVFVLSVNMTVKSEEVKDPAPFKTNLQDEIKNKLCVDLKKYFEKESYPLVIGVGEFISTPEVDANYSNAIKNTITGELKNIGFTVEKKAKYYLEGKYSKILSGNKNPFSVKFSLSLNDSESLVQITTFPLKIDDYTEMAQALGVTAGLGKQAVAPVPPGDVKKQKEIRENYIEAVLPPSKDINKKIEKDFITPSFYLDKDLDLIRANESSPYGIKILVKYGEQYKAIPIKKNDDNRPCVDLKKGDIYKIELVNNSNYEAAAKVLIDGLNTFSFSEILGPDNKHLKNYHIIDKHGKSVVDGWEKNNERVYEFLTDALGKGNQQAVKPVHGTGVITVSFSVSYESNNKPNFILGTLGFDKLETVPGKEVDSKTIFVKRVIADKIDFISIRYSH